jgi:hypothetical protein
MFVNMASELEDERRYWGKFDGIIDIETTYEAVLEFIRWYNNQKTRNHDNTDLNLEMLTIAMLEGHRVRATIYSKGNDVCDDRIVAYTVCKCWCYNLKDDNGVLYASKFEKVKVQLSVSLTDLIN